MHKRACNTEEAEDQDTCMYHVDVHRRQGASMCNLIGRGPLPNEAAIS